MTKKGMTLNSLLYSELKENPTAKDLQEILLATSRLIEKNIFEVKFIDDEIYLFVNFEFSTVINENIARE